MEENMKIKIVLLVSIIFVSGCSTFDRMFPDRSTEYRRAESLPDLEIPPDLTAAAANDRMSIPGEGGQYALSSQQQNRPSTWAEIRSIDRDRSLLSIPAELTTAWTDIENILQGETIVLEGTDPEKGIMNVTYVPETEEGWLSRMAFWRNSSQAFMLRFTAVEDATELVVLDEEGDWATGLEAERLLAAIRTRYNNSKGQ